MNRPKALSFLVLLAIEMPFALLAANPEKMTTEARLDITSATVKLENGTVLTGNGKIARMNWVADEAKARSYTANFAVSHYAWNEVAVRFVPAADGLVELKLMGPWEEASKGVAYRETVVWKEQPEISGATSDPPAKPWSGTAFSDAKGGPNSAYFARTWHNEPATTTLRVTKDLPVVIRLQAKAETPAGFKEMRRLAPYSQAFASARMFRRGANLGNYLEAPPGQNWGVNYSTEDFAHIKEEGFDHVRIPIAWHHYTGPAPDFILKPEMVAKVDFLLTNAVSHGLNAIINIHHFDPFTSNPTAETNRFYALWRQIAAHYAGSPPGVAFELLNEPKDKATTVVLNPIFAETIRIIRQSNPNRAIFVGPGKWNSIEELPALQLPDDDDNLIVTVHCYDPYYFSHQGASWGGPDVKVTGIVFPGPPATPLVPDPALRLNNSVIDWISRYNSEPTETNPSSPKAFRSKLAKAREWSVYYGRPIHVGEFGAFVGANDQSRANFYRAFRQSLDELDLGWAIWDWKAGFHYWDQAKNRQAPGLRNALFP